VKTKSKKELEREELERMADAILKEDSKDSNKSEDIFDRCERVELDGVEYYDPATKTRQQIYFKK